jgi:hypothetical protein
MAKLFDPLAYLKGELHVIVDIGPDGLPSLMFERRIPIKHQQEARTIAKRYSRLLVLQIKEGRVSVQKLIAQGKIQLKAGRYVGRNP